MVLTALSADSLCFASSDMGVQRFEWNASVTNPVYPFSPKSFKVRVLVYLKYTHWRGGAQVRGFLMADTRDAAKPADGVPLEPSFTLRAGAQQHSFTASCQVHSYWDPPKQSAMVYGFEASFPLDPANVRHEYQLASSLDPSRTYTWRPLKALNHMDGRGAEVPPVALPGSAPPPPAGAAAAGKRQAYVVLKPLYNFSPNIYAPLIQRHMEYYQALGVDKHIIYLRRESIPMLLGSPKMARAAQMGRLIVVEWDGLEEHVVWHRQYDQRVIYSHATLVFTHMDVYLLNIDLDEYLVTNRPELQDKSLQEIVETCAGGPAVDVRIQRHHVVCKTCDRDRPEAMLWADEQEAPQHPLSWYHLVNLKDLPKRRSLVNPNFVHAYYMHHGALRAGTNASYPEAACLSLLHMPNLLRVRDEADLVEANYVEDHAWMGMLRRLQSAVQPPAPSAIAAAARPSTTAAASTGRRLHGSVAAPDASALAAARAAAAEGGAALPSLEATSWHVGLWQLVASGVGAKWQGQPWGGVPQDPSSEVNEEASEQPRRQQRQGQQGDRDHGHQRQQQQVPTPVGASSAALRRELLTRLGARGRTGSGAGAAGLGQRDR